MLLRFVNKEETLKARPCRWDETIESKSWRDDWQAVLSEAISAHDPWCLLLSRPDGDSFIFEATDDGAYRAARWGTECRLLFPDSDTRKELCL